MDLKQEIRDFSYDTASGDKIKSLQPVCEVQVSMISLFTVIFVFEMVMCKVKHFFPTMYMYEQGTEAVRHIHNATVYT